MAKEKGTYTAGGISMTEMYQDTRNKEKTIEELRTATKALIENDIDILICEVPFFGLFLLSFLTFFDCSISEMSRRWNGL